MRKTILVRLGSFERSCLRGDFGKRIFLAHERRALPELNCPSPSRIELLIAIRGSNHGSALSFKDKADPWLLPRIAISSSILDGEGQFSSGKALLSCAKNILLPKSPRKHERSKEPRRTKIVFLIDQIL